MGPQEVEAWKEPGYFAATEPPGVQRAAAMLQESAFWSTHLFRASAARMQIWLVGCGIAALVCLLAGPVLWPGAAHRVLIPVFSVLASSLVFLEWLIRVMQYHAAAIETGEILQRLESLRAAGFPKDDFLLILVDYNSAVEAAPMMAPGVFKANHDRLDRIWREQYGS
jgi:hypothetical protein